MQMSWIMHGSLFESQDSLGRTVNIKRILFVIHPSGSTILFKQVLLIIIQAFPVNAHEPAVARFFKKLQKPVQDSARVVVVVSDRGPFLWEGVVPGTIFRPSFDGVIYKPQREIQETLISGVFPDLG